MGRRPRRAVVVVATAAAAVTLSACSPAQTLLGLQANTAVLSNSPAVTPGQASTIATRAITQAQRADALRTSAAAQTAYTGLALTMAPSRYVVEKVIDPDSDPGGALAPVAQPSRIVVTAGRAFPRTVLAVWQPESARALEAVLMRSDDVRTPFRVALRVDLLPGQVLPPTPPNTRGASVLADDVGGLVATPRQAVADLAALLQTGTSPGTPFESSVVVREVRSKASAQARDVKKVATFSQRHAARDDGTTVIRTADGGALVFAAINRTDLFTVRRGAGVITPPPAYRALASGLKKITRSATVTTVETVVLVVPPRGEGSVRVIGFSEVPVAVKGS
ncbi:MAG: hypothetical protein ACTHN8_10145 [Angustibacter sp.]